MPLDLDTVPAYCPEMKKAGTVKRTAEEKARLLRQIEDAPSAERDKKFWDVCAKQCDACLFSPNRLVSARRAAEIIAQIDNGDGISDHFVCHKGSLANRDVQCHVEFKREPFRTFAARLAGMAGRIRFLDDKFAPVAAPKWFTDLIKGRGKK